MAAGLVHAPAVEDEHERPTQMAPEAAEEVDQIDGPDVLRLHPPIQAQAAPARGHREHAGDRETIMTLPLPEQRRLAPWCPRPPDQRLEHKAALIQEDEALAGAPRVFLYAATGAAASARSRPRRAPGPGARASADSSRSRAGSSTRAPDGSGRRRRAR